MSRTLIIHTSVDDLRSSLYHINPAGKDEIKKVCSQLWDNVLYEKEHSNRSSVIKMLIVKIKKLEKLT